MPSKVVYGRKIAGQNAFLKVGTWPKKVGFFAPMFLGMLENSQKPVFMAKKSGQMAIFKTPFWPERICEKWQNVVKNHKK